MATARPGLHGSSMHGVARIAFFYPPVLLAVFAFQGSFPESLASLALALLLLLAGAAAWGNALVISSGVSLFFILALAESYVGMWSIALSAPTLIPMMYGLSLAAEHVELPQRARGFPRPSVTGASLALGLTTLFVLGLVSGSIPLMAGSTLAAVAIVAESSAWLWRMRSPLATNSEPVSVVAGELVKARVNLSAPAGSIAGVSTTQSTVGITPHRVWLGPTPLTFDVSTRPLLSGPRTVQADVVLADPLGLITLGRECQLLNLSVIPRARALRLAALRFLEGHSQGGTTMSAAVSEALAHMLAHDSGVEYLGSRAYAPGDRLHSVDWKHTARLQRPIVKTFSSEPHSTGLLLVNLAVADEDEADRLAYELLSAALTLGRERMNTTVIAYGAQETTEHPRVMTDRELVRRALELVSAMIPHQRYSRILQIRPVHAVTGLRVHAGRHDASGSDLLKVLAFEEQALRRSVETHPLTRALREAQRNLNPTWCLAISNLGNDGEALVTGLHGLEKSGVNTLLLDIRTGFHGALQRQSRTLSGRR
ncbi:MAG: DUF58 domain-containing protein [Chloroflexota bacterium]